MQDTKQPVTTMSKWKRLLYTLFFGVVFSLTKFLFASLVIIQLLFMLIMNSPNKQILKLSKIITDYIYKIIIFMTFQSNEVPFPFKEKLIMLDDSDDIKENKNFDHKD